MRTSIRTAGAVTLAAALLATACSSTETSPEAGPGASRTTPVELGDIKLVSYSGCDDMLTGLRTETAKNVGPWGLGGPVIMYAEALSAARADAGAAKGVAGAPEHSTTNVHEAGVDEPDLVKTDGNRVITVNRGVLRVVDTATRKVTGTLRLVDAEQAWAPADLLISGDRALVLFSGGGIIPFGARAKRAASPGPRYVLVDLSGPPKVLGSLTPNGAHVDARMVGSTVRVVVRSQPEIDFSFPDADPGLSDGDRTRLNRDVVAKTPVEAWLPKFEVTAADGTTSKGSVRCEQISHPAEYTGTSMLTVHSLDLSPGVTGISETAPIGVAADGDTVYGTGSSLYVTSNPRWWWPRPIIDDSALAPTRTPTETEPPRATPAAPQSEPTPTEPSVTLSPGRPPERRARDGDSDADPGAPEFHGGSQS
ncbi:beta-propeller domain-containing protein [Streptosporangium lutulentum]